MTSLVLSLRRGLLWLLGAAPAESIVALNARLSVVEDDLDCDEDGSVAHAVGEIAASVRGLRARLDEWEPGRAADEMHGQKRGSS